MFAKRRDALMQKMGARSLGVWFASPVRLRSRDTDHVYRASSDLLYLANCPEPEAVLILRPDADEERSILFVRPRDKEREIWMGRRLGPERAKEHYGVDAAYAIDELDTKITSYLLGCEKIYHQLGDSEANDRRVIEWKEGVKRQRRVGKVTPDHILDSRALTDEMRLFKDSAEMEHMRHAAKLTAEAHEMAMAMTRPGTYEYQIEAMMHYHFRKNGCLDFAYTPIVGGGANATILHYTENQDALKDGDLVLIDVGAEYQFYAADITRTYPVSGKFTDTQRRVYEIVLAALQAGIDACQPGNRFDDVHQAAVAVLTQGLVDLGVLEGDVQTLIEEEAYKPYYMHKTGHWLGLDVHDVGGYFEEDGSSRILQPGMVLTVEPGLYFNPDFHDVPEARPFADIGIRIEDDILITEDGHENLTAAAPKSVADVLHFEHQSCLH